MKSKLLILPFLALFVASMAIVTGSAFSSEGWIHLSLWGFAGLLFASWIILDKEGLRKAFTKKSAKYGASSGLTLILGVLVIIGIGFLSSRPRFNKSVDVTRDKLNTLSDQTFKIVKQFDESTPIEVLAFFQDEMKQVEFTQALDLYQGAGLKVDVEYIDPQTDPTRAIAANVTTADTVILKYASREARLTSFGEEKITNALMKVLKSNQKTIYFTLGHGERSLSDSEAAGYQIVKEELESERYLVKDVNLLEAGEIPSDADILVVAGPKYDFRQKELDLIEAYLNRAKPIFILVDAMTNLPALKTLTTKYGLTFEDDFLILRPDDPRAQMIGQNNAIVTDFDQFSPATRDFAAQGTMALVVPNSRSIQEIKDNEKGMLPSLVARTAEIIIGVSGVKSQKDLEGIGPERIQGGPFGVIGLAAGQVGGDEIAENAPTGNSAQDVDTEKGKVAKELRLALVGSSEMVSNAGAQRGENIDMFMNLMNYLLQDEDFISIRPKDLTESSLDVSSASSQLLLLFFAYIYPTVFLGGGVYYWMRRRKA